MDDPGMKVLTRVSYFAIDKDGSVWTAHDGLKMREWWGAAWAYKDDEYQAFHWGPGALSLLADRRFLWMVETSEPLMDLKATAKMQFGVTAEMVKSLFYSRTIPVTATGRLKPILHWVESHKRRLKEGIEVDVTKHLRGVENFEMGGLIFNITSPVKTNPYLKR